MRAEATTKLSELRSAIDDLNEQMNLATDGFDLPEIDVPQPEIDADIPRQSLVAFGDNWITATRALKARKSYGNGNGNRNS